MEKTFFAEIDDNYINELNKISLRKKVLKQSIIFSQDEKADALFILARGRIDLISTSSTGKEKLIRSVKEGETFAEAAMFAGETYPATAVAYENSEIIKVPKNAFIKFISQNPQAALQIMGAMAKLLRHLNKMLTDISLSSVNSRLAQYLLRKINESESNEITLKISKKELAFKLGTISETLSRAFGKLQKDGLIKVKNNKISILNKKFLSELT